jgi:hypothetical protein
MLRAGPGRHRHACRRAGRLSLHAGVPTVLFDRRGHFLQVISRELHFRSTSIAPLLVGENASEYRPLGRQRSAAPVCATFPRGLSLIESIFDAFHFIGKALGKIRAKFRCTCDASTGREQHADD